jgi:anti-sigma factor RsiW
MTAESEAKAEGGGVHDDIEALLSDYVEGGLTAAEHSRVEAHLAGCAACRAAHQELRETIDALSGLHKQPAPPELTAGVTETIHRRSGGRFFGRRAFGDRVPFELLAILALLVAIGLYLVLRSSDTGSLRYQGEPDTPKIAPGAREAVPLP